MKRLSHISSITLMIIMALQCEAQDLHFSQFYSTPLFTNPASIGSSHHDFRIGALHRNQWRSVTKPFSSFLISAEAYEPLDKENFGLGIQFYNDITGDSRFKTFSASISIAYTLDFSDSEGEEMSFGGQFGFTQQSIDEGALRFGEQYNGTSFDPSFDNGERLDLQNVTHPDIHIGLMYRKTSNSREHIHAGFSWWNLITPDVSLSGDASVLLDQRLNLHGEYSRTIADRWDAIPAAQFSLQGSYRELLVGSRFRYSWKDDALMRRRAYIGAFGRAKDAIYLMLGMDYDRWTVGLSYDVNTSSLQVASQNRGGIEITTIYEFDLFKEKYKPHGFCPVFL